MIKLWLHHIDVLNDQFIRGWCFNRLQKHKALSLTIHHQNEIVGHGPCNLFRSDVLDSAMHPSGYCGFEIDFKMPLKLNSGGDLTLKVANGLVAISNIPVTQINQVLKLEQPFCFMHIPKTAGTSFNNHVESWFAKGHWHNHIESKNLSVRKKIAQPGNYIAGHLPVQHFQQLIHFGGSTPLHTIVRHPAEQLRSHLGWIKSIGKNQHNTFFQQHPAVVQQLAKEMQHIDFNTIASLESFVHNLSGFQLDFFDNIQTRYFLEYRPDRVTSSDCKHALKNTALFTSIGTTEDYQGFLNRCSQLYGRISAPGWQTTHNRSKVPPVLDLDDTKVQRVILPLIEHDMILYSHICNG